ncbi:MAG: FHA domain-containing protein [Myxococcota bacterium]|nr:FHA domain-containing protein [Myxococcota bacterium]
MNADPHQRFGMLRSLLAAPVDSPTRVPELARLCAQVKKDSPERFAQEWVPHITSHALVVQTLEDAARLVGILPLGSFGVVPRADPKPIIMPNHPITLRSHEIELKKLRAITLQLQVWDQDGKDVGRIKDIPQGHLILIGRRPGEVSGTSSSKRPRLVSIKGCGEHAQWMYLGIEDPLVSPRHAIMRGTTTGVEVYDMESASGTYVYEHLDRKFEQCRRLERGDVSFGRLVRFGHTEFQITHEKHWQESTLGQHPFLIISRPRPRAEPHGGD